MGKFVVAAAIFVALASTGVFLYRQDFCVVAVSQGYTAIVRGLLLIGCCSHVDPTTTKPLLITAVQYGHLHTAKGILDSGADVHATDKAGRTALHHAADKDDTALVELLIQAGADVQAPDRDGFTPLMTAAVHGRQAVVERLLASRADVNALNRFRESALSLSAAKGHGGIVALLLEHNADVNVQDENGQTPLVKAVAREQHEVAALLLSHRDISIDNVGDLLEKVKSGRKDSYARVVTRKLEELRDESLIKKLPTQNKSVDVSFLEACLQGRQSDVESFISMGKNATERDVRGRDCLMLAAEHGHVDIVMLTMRYGWDVNARTPDKLTPLMLASSSNRVRVVEFLSRHVDLSQTDSMGRTALALAVLHGHADVVVLLKKIVANPIILDMHGNSLAHLAAEGGHSRVLKVLLEDKATLINIQNSIGRTPLMHAAERGHVEATEFLVSAGADINVKDRFLQTALHIVVRRGDTSTVSLFVSKGAEVDAADSAGVTPLMMAARYGRLDVAMSLVEAGAAVSRRNLLMKTPLILAAENGHHALVSFLLSQGANPQVRDREGNSALNLAASGGDVATLRALVDAHADLEVKDRKGRSALYLAASGGHVTAVAFLLERGAYVDSADMRQRTPVMAAAAAGWVEVVQALLDKGASVHVTDYDGHTAMTLAGAGFHNEVAVRLSEAEAQIDPSLFTWLLGLWRCLIYYPIVPITWLFLAAFGAQNSLNDVPKATFVFLLAVVVPVVGRSLYVSEHFSVRFSSLSWLNDTWLVIIGTVLYSLVLIVAFFMALFLVLSYIFNKNAGIPLAAFIAIAYFAAVLFQAWFLEIFR